MTVLLKDCFKKYYFFFVVIYAGLTMQATILATMFIALESGKITAPLNLNLPANQNVAFIQDFLLNLLKTAFPHLNEWVFYFVLFVELFHTLMVYLFILCVQCLIADNKEKKISYGHGFLLLISYYILEWLVTYY